MPPDEFNTRLIPVAGFDHPQLVLGMPQRYGGHLSDALPQSSAEQSSFGIQTSAAVA
jgi:hypothetical protein